MHSIQVSSQAASRPAGNQVYSTEVQRWCPDRECFAATKDQLPTGQADVFEVCISLHSTQRTAHSVISTCLLDMQPHLGQKLQICCLKSLQELAGARHVLRIQLYC